MATTSRETYVALLRGINVNGCRKILMAELRASLEREGSFRGVRTWLQTGNVIFQSSLSDTEDLSKKIKSVIQADFGWDDVPVMIRTGQQMRETLEQNPFLSDEKKYEAKRLFVAFVDEEPCPEMVADMNKIDYSPEEYAIHNELSAIYFYVPDFAKYKLDTTLFEKKLKISATSRNWKTTSKLVGLVREISTGTGRNSNDETENERSSSKTKPTVTKQEVKKESPRRNKRRRN